MLQVLNAAKLVDTANWARSHLGQVPIMQLLIVNNLGAGRPLVDRLWLVSAVHLACKVASAVSQFKRFEGHGLVPVPTDVVCVEATAGYHVLGCRSTPQSVSVVM